jgi:DNA-binding PucR family transcriptional regulator
MLLQDEEMARAHVAGALGPLERLPAPERERLLETLAAWLAHQRLTPRIAAELHVHPQTVRYRIGKLRELLGERIETPQGRFELELALRARRALSAS